MTLTRENLLEKLITNDLDIFYNLYENEDYVYSLLRTGFKGYENYTDEELAQEWYERTEEKVEIIKETK